MKIYRKYMAMAVGALLAMVLTMTSCVDDFPADRGEIDGSTRTLSVEVAFEPTAEADLNSRATDGDAMQDITSLHMLIYNIDGELIEDYTVWKNAAGGYHSGVIWDEDNKRADNRLPEEQAANMQDRFSGRLTYKMKLPTGRYYIYAIANIDDLSRSDYATREQLKSIYRKWETDPAKISLNSEMFGAFSKESDRNATRVDSPVVITNYTSTLHCWLRRLASKVTVAFDGRGLYDNVQIYVKDITIKGIAKGCYLGRDNIAGQKDLDDPLSRIDPAQNASAYNGVHATGDTIHVQTLDKGAIVPDNYLHVCKISHPFLAKGDDKENLDSVMIDKRHEYKARSLFFYENLQGIGKDKRQDANGDNKVDHPGLGPDPDKYPEYIDKDNKPFGTYVEVTAWYRCVSPDQHVSEGDITYRFMLGKDVMTNYDVERNTHYKLTLCFKGYGNDADWHIEYDEDRNIQVASPMYISYLYNKKAMAVVKVNGTMPEGAKLRADILYDSSDPNTTSWKPWGDGSTSFPNPNKSFFSQVAVTDDGPWNSFLSLQQTKVVKIESEELAGAPSNKYPTDASALAKIQKDYYTKNNIGWRLYETTPKKTGGYDGNGIDENGMYFVRSIAGGEDQTTCTSRQFTIPLYTRAKELITKTGFVGNNPYTEYPRKAKVQFKVVDKNGADIKDFQPVIVDVIQVRRILNPKGVWRSADNADDFHVTLMRLPDEESNFEPFKSEGKWSAEIISEPGMNPIYLSSTYEGSGATNTPQTRVSRIDGESEHNIDFMINFNGTEGCAIVRVRYHNYTCEHDIFVRKGYETPISVTDNDSVLWPSFNIAMFTKDEDGKEIAVPTKSPLEEGALFRRGNSTAILAKNSLSVAQGGNGYGLFNVKPSKLAVIKSDAKGVESEMAWDKITPSVPVTGSEKRYNSDGKLVDHNYSDWIIKTENPNERIATCDDYYTMISEQANAIDFPIAKAYGVLYGDGATITQSNREIAYGYNYTDGRKSERGMRGVFVYNNQTCRQIFFPIGASGYGHRNGNLSDGWAMGYGRLRYAGRQEQMTSSDLLSYQPLFMDIYKFFGAIYWTQRYYPSMPNAVVDGHWKSWYDVKSSCAFDMNFRTLGFEGYGGNDAVPSGATSSHGCFIRTVIDNKSTSK